MANEIIAPQIDPIGKTQFIRLLDVFLIGPFMIYAGMKSKDTLIKGGLITTGLATIAFNGTNYLEQERIRY